MAMTRYDKKRMYFSIYMLYKNSDATLEEIGMKYNLTKQRVWQIVRMCKLGHSDYYKGLKVYNEVCKKVKEKYPNMHNDVLRGWLRENGIRLIKSKNGSKISTSNNELG